VQFDLAGASDSHNCAIVLAEPRDRVRYLGRVQIGQLECSKFFSAGIGERGTAVAGSDPCLDEQEAIECKHAGVSS
jgi:hypothetical protein